MHAYKIRIEFVWGHQSRIIGLSKTNPSYYYPPPTTILGSIGEVLAKEYRLGEKPETTRRLIAELSSKLLAIGLKPINAVPLKHMDINKIVAVKITAGKNYPRPSDLGGSFDAPARGKTIFSSIDNNPPLLDLILVFSDTVFNIGGKRVKLYEDILWGIHRLGSKESIVSITRVEYSRNIKTRNGVIVTKYSFPITNGVEVIEEIRRKWVHEVYIDPFKIDPRVCILEAYLHGRNIVVYRVPLKIPLIGDPSIKLNISHPMTAYIIRFNRRTTETVVGRII